MSEAQQQIELRPGDWFCTTSVGSGGWRNQLLSAAIRKASVRHNKDGKAFFTHSGIVLDKTGTTFEARWTYGKFHINDYIGGPIIIGRAHEMTLENFLRGYCTIYRYQGKAYPLWRILMFLSATAPNISLTKRPVCSELVAMHALASHCNILGDFVGRWQGQTPSNLADYIRKWGTVFTWKFETQNWQGVAA